ncbi:MAG TPA: hypothetical protein VL588_01255 [Bdellovibrionota bacterium]|jgi:hypothetical protein|nr:hypothetical protein [Bdellovibrionota bacterium]
MLKKKSSEKRIWKRVMAAASLLSLSAVLGACGSSGDPFKNSIGLPLGTGTGGVVGDFNTYCAQRGGMVTLSGQNAICTIRKNFTIADFGYFPYLTPSQPAGPSAAPAGYYSQFYVRPGDKLIFQGSGGWGTLSTSTSSYLGGLINFSWTSAPDCDSIPLSGYGATNEGMRAALVGSVGGNAPFIIGNSTSKVFTQEGYFKFGFNAPIDQNVIGLCYQVYITRFEIDHCESNSGATIACP